MQGKVPYTVVYSSIMNCLCSSVGSLSMMKRRRWSLLSQSYRTKCVKLLFPEMPFNTETPNSTASESDHYQLREEQQAECEIYILYIQEQNRKCEYTCAHANTNKLYRYIHPCAHTHKLPSACSDCIAVRVVYTLTPILTVVLTLKAIADTRPTHHNHMNCTSAWYIDTEM